MTFHIEEVELLHLSKMQFHIENLFVTEVVLNPKHIKYIILTSIWQPYKVKQCVLCQDVCISPIILVSKTYIILLSCLDMKPIFMKLGMSFQTFRGENKISPSNQNVYYLSTGNRDSTTFLIRAFATVAPIISPTPTPTIPTPTPDPTTPTPTPAPADRETNLLLLLPQDGGGCS